MERILDHLPSSIFSGNGESVSEPCFAGILDFRTGIPELFTKMNGLFSETELYIYAQFMRRIFTAHFRRRMS